MAFGSLGGNQDSEPMAEINMVPMIDVMLVLLIIFIVTAPLLTHSVKVELPKGSSAPSTQVASAIELGIDANSRVFWNGEELDAQALQSHMKTAAGESLLPELHLSIDRATRFEKVAEVMSMASSLGLTKLAFITDPTKAKP